MKARLVLFEDRHWPDLSPLTDLLPVPALAFGASSLGARWTAAVQGSLLGVETRSLAFAAESVAPRPVPVEARADEWLFAANAAALPGPWLEEAGRHEGPGVFVTGERVVAARLTAGEGRPGLGRGAAFAEFLAGLGLPRRSVDARLVEWPWQMIEWNAGAIASDLAAMRGDARGEVHRLACLERPERISIGPGARVDAFAVLDAREGPIRIGPGAVIQSHTRVVGPCVVGEGTHLLGGAIGRSTIGPGCRIAGEVDESIWQGWANKRHHGFVGHSAIGEWTNLGALTTTSDLKNNYGTVRVHAAGGERDSGLTKLGAILGAGVKTGIGTLLPTGASVGTGSHLFGGGRYAPRHLPAFSWWNGEDTRDYEIEKFIATARVAMGRRERRLGAEHESALRALFQATAAERRGAAGRGRT